MQTMRAPTSAFLTKEEEARIRKWVQPFHPVRQRTVRAETTKDKAGTLPIALYRNEQRGQVVPLEVALDDSSSSEGEGAEGEEEEEIYDTSSSSESETDIQEEENIPNIVSTKVGRRIRAPIRLDL